MISKITTNQAKSIFKAVQYAFVSGFFGSLVIQSADVVKAIHDGHSALTALGVSVVAGAIIGGINGAAFAVEKLFTSDPTVVTAPTPEVISPSEPTQIEVK